MSAIDATRLLELDRLIEDLRRAARTIRAQTLAERRDTQAALVAAVREGLEVHAQLDQQGLEALGAWTEVLEQADVADLDRLQELLYGLDALVRVHLWRETGLPLRPPEPRSRGDV